MAVHTQGEWIAEQGGRLIESKETGRIIARVLGAFKDDEADANAILLLASPQLLEALEYAIPFLFCPCHGQRHYGGCIRCAVLEKAAKAVAKAVVCRCPYCGIGILRPIQTEVGSGERCDRCGRKQGY